MKIKLYCDCSECSHYEEIIEVPDDTGDDELYEMAEDLMWGRLRPSSGFEKVDA